MAKRCFVLGGFLGYRGALKVIRVKDGQRITWLGFELQRFPKQSKNSIKKKKSTLEKK